LSKQLFTPKQVARAIGVSESSLKRWCDRGLIPTVRTAGGHRRLPVEGVLAFLRQSRRALVHPELLGLPALSGRGSQTLRQARQRLIDSLVRGEDMVCRQVILELYLAGQRLCVIFDEVVAEAFHQIGEKWETGEVEVYQEHRACEICERGLRELRLMLPPPQASRPPRAIGGAIDGDPYRLPTMLVEIVLRVKGWAATSLGPLLPFATLRAAVERESPELVWLSASSIADLSPFLRDYNAFFAEISPGVPVVVGGRALTEKVRKQMNYTVYCDNLQHLESFLASFRPQA